MTGDKSQNGQKADGAREREREDGGTDEQDLSAVDALKPGLAGAEGEVPEEPHLGDAPIAILELAESCRRFVHAALQVELDYDVETLPVLDGYLRLAEQGVTARPETEDIVGPTVAAYFGEVVRRRIEGFWRRAATGEAEWRLCARRAFLSMSPLGMVKAALAESDEHDGPSAELGLAPSDQEVAAARLAVFPDVPEDEYYLLSTRLEVIETVYEALRDRMRAEGRESIVFEEEDYDDE